MTERTPLAGWLRNAPAILLLAVAAGVAVRGVLLSLPPLFITDVYFYNAQAPAYLLGGVDPYGASYSVPLQLATSGAGTVFAYLPGVFAFLVPGSLGAGARLGLVACDLVVAGALVAAGRSRGWLMAAVFLLLPPIALFSTSFLNDSLPAVAFLSVAVALEAKGRHVPAGVLLGLALASSQEAWFVVPVYLAYSARRHSFRGAAAALVSAVAVVAPFAAWNFSAFVEDTLLFQFQRGAVPLLSAGPFGLNVNPSLQGILLSAGAGLPVLARGGVTAALLAFVVWRARPTLGYLLWGSSLAVAGSLFLLAGDFFWSYLELPFVLGLFWAGLSLGFGPERSTTLKEPEAGVASPAK
ncbi:MAG: DUF2029 domain-containing protein [Nitrososphaerota archaeon]|nr:DUF2029 domain-containing protein [Nitrososphaerota archaeon]